MLVRLIESSDLKQLRRDRLAKVLKSGLNKRRAAKQALKQLRGAGRDADQGPEDKVRKNVNRLQVLTQRHDGLRGKQVKRMKTWAKKSSWAVSSIEHRNRKGVYSRPALDTDTRPANPKTYGKGKFKVVFKSGVHGERDKP